MTTTYQTIIDKLKEKIPSSALIQDAPMAEHTSFRAGGKADLLVTAEDEEQLRHALQVLTTEDCPHMLLGNGTNVLVKDGGYRGVILHLGEGFRTIRREGDSLICGGAALLSAIARKAQQEGLGGFAFASGIPGSMGGAVFMNAGAYGGEMADILETVRVISPDGGEVKTMDVRELDLGYRHSRLQETGDVVTEARIALHPQDPEEILREMSELTAKRNAKQPVTYPSAGSFFKRPEGYFAGKLIQDAGLKGLQIGGAQVSSLHSGFIINTGNATATDILRLKEVVQARVYEKFQVKLEPEVRIIGE